MKIFCLSVDIMEVVFGGWGGYVYYGINFYLFY